jgi:Fe2+ or Zn2+ uptake regulation protein
MLDYVYHAVSKLKEAGLKITKPRKLLVELLVNTEKALSPYEMRDILMKKKIKADVVTIYRILEVLEELGLVHKVLALNAYIRCHINELGKAGRKCHHYLLCRNCHKFEEFQSDDFPPFQKMMAGYYKKFHIESHYLEFVGLCSDCQKKVKEKKDCNTCDEAAGV